MSDEKRKYMVLRVTPQLTLGQIFEIIISECENGCTDADSASAYLYKHYAGRFNSGEVFVLTQCLDFEAVRRLAPHITLDIPAIIEAK